MPSILGFLYGSAEYLTHAPISSGSQDFLRQRQAAPKRLLHGLSNQFLGKACNGHVRKGAGNAVVTAIPLRRVASSGAGRCVWRRMPERRRDALRGTVTWTSVGSASDSS
jgi:hypothetical protein